MNLEFIFYFYLQVTPVLGMLISYFGSQFEAQLSPCGQSFEDVDAFLLHCAICCLIICITERFMQLPVIHLPPMPLLLLLPTRGIEYFVRKKSPFGNCLFHKLVTQRSWMLYSCLIYFENFATELTLINELNVVSNKLCVGYIDWEGFQKTRLGFIMSAVF